MVIIAGSSSNKTLKIIENYLNEIDDNQLEVLKFIERYQKTEEVVPETKIYEIFGELNHQRTQLTLYEATERGLLSKFAEHKKDDLVLVKGDKVYYEIGNYVYHIRDDLTETVEAMKYRESEPSRIGMEGHFAGLLLGAGLI